MSRIAALVMVVVLVVVARHLEVDADRFATMALGFVLIVAALVGEAAGRMGLPRLTGYLLTGLALGPSVLDVLTPRMAAGLSLVNGLAVALIAFSAGVEMDLAALRASWKSLVRHGGLLIGGLFVGLFVAALAVAPHVPFVAAMPWSRRVAVCLVYAAVMATFSPTVTMAVLSETRAKGPLAERTLAVSVMGDLALVLIFTLSMTLARLLDNVGSSPLSIGGLVGEAARHVTVEVLGSLFVGIVAGIGVALYRRIVNRRNGLVIAATCLVLAEVGSRLGLSSVLTCLMAGLVVRNVAPDAAHELDELLDRVSVPVLVVFFAGAGASLDLSAVRTLLPVVAGTVVLRAILIFAMNRAGSKAAKLDTAVAERVPFGLVSQAGVTMGLVIVVGRGFTGWGASVETICLAVIALNVLVGPVLFRFALARAGEIPSAEAPAAQPEPG